MQAHWNWGAEAVGNVSADMAWTERASSDKWTVFFDRMRRNWGLAVGVIATSLAVSLILAFALPSYWRVEIVVMPVPKNSAGNMSLAALAGGLAGFGAMLGRQNSTEDEALAVLRSRELFDVYATQRNLLPILFSSKWDSENRRWDVSQARIPTLRTGYRLFNNHIRDVDVDRRTGIVTLGITWKDRQQAAQWARDLINLTNEQLRQRAIAQALQNMRYLNDQMRNEQGIGASNALNTALATAFEHQLQDYMFAKGQREFAFRIIDPPTIPDDRERVWPQRRLFLALGLILGCVFAVGAVHLREYLRQRQDAGRSWPMAQTIPTQS